MERDEQGQSDVPTSPGNVPHDPQGHQGQHVQPPQVQQVQQQQQLHPQSPQAALASVTRGENPSTAPPAPPKTDRDPIPRSRPMSSATEKTPVEEGTTSAHGSLPMPRDRNDPYRIAAPQRARSRDDGVYRSGEGVVPPTRRRGSGLDWIIPANGENKTYTPRQRTVGERLQPTLDHAIREKAKYERKAMLNGYTLNLAIGLQVLLGALVTGLSAAVSPSKVGITTSVLGGLSTLVASYLARMRGSNEPELSITRAKDLDQFIRECDAFQMDKGHVVNGPEEDAAVETLRHRFEELLGNANGERKLSSA